MKFGFCLHTGDPCGCERYRYDLSAYRQQPGAGIYLPGVKTIVYSSERFAKRRQRCEEILIAFGFRDWRFFLGRDTANYWLTTSADHAKLLRENEPPFLLLEDDVEPRDFRAWIDPPAGTQLAYLGGYRRGDMRGIRNARAAGLHPKRYAGYGYTPINSEWFRPFGMWSSHAILWLDRGAMNEAAGILECGPVLVDSMLALNQWRWQCAALRMPAFWQNDGHNWEHTYDYAPDPNWVRDTILAAGHKCRRPAYDRRTALRLTRQRILHAH